MSNKILVVDDEPKIVDLVRTYLEKQGYDVAVAQDGKQALLAAARERPGLVILDLNLPEMDGIDVFRKLRATSNIPVIMLTARSEDVDKLLGLEMGADDYVTKPFSPRELVARVKAVLRRTSGGATEGEEIRTNGLVIDLRAHSVKRNGEELALTPTEFALLGIFARNQGRVFTRSELLDLTQGVSFESFERTIDVHVKNLRQKIEDDPQRPKCIVTVYGVGYRFEGCNVS
ncbi:MAG: response regulator transcription factor [Chloroflexi bacterium]|nr:response regulator transcription factor [Chloroflexota bacterium]